MDEQIRIVIGGDIVPTDSNIKYFEDVELDKIVSSDLLRFILNADARIFNLETPLSDVLNPIEKEGPCFIAGTKTINGLKQLKPTAFTLANNHILDQGIQGLESTEKVLVENNIQYFGVGNNISEANEEIILDIKGTKIAIFGCVEHEFTTATQNRAGANPFDALEIADTIRNIKKKADYLIVLYHGGREYYEYPSPELRRRCRKMVSCGADVILCQHSHCIGTYEEYDGGKILYGQGNFILDHYVKAYEEFFQSGLIVELIIEKNKIDWELYPIQREKCGVRFPDSAERTKILDNLKDRSTKILEEGFVEKQYKKYSETNASRFLIRFMRFGFVLSSLDTHFFGGKILNRSLKKFLGKHQRLAIQNCLQCEVYNELLRTYLENGY